MFSSKFIEISHFSAKQMGRLAFQEVLFGPALHERYLFELVLNFHHSHIFPFFIIQNALG